MKELEKGIKGDNIPGYNEFWKDRLAMKPYGVGKSGGLRIISYHIDSKDLIVPAIIYPKVDRGNPSHQMMIEASDEIRNWLTSEDISPPTA
jgi:hypothetical protein